jgi:hypothetical protein
LAIRNGPNIEAILNLPLQSDMRVWREKDGWIDLFKLFAIDSETCTIDMPYRLTNFRLTVVKLYYILLEASQEEEEIEDIEFFDSDKDKLID